MDLYSCEHCNSEISLNTYEGNGGVCDTCLDEHLNTEETTMNDATREKVTTFLAQNMMDMMFGDGLEFEYIMDGCTFVGLNNLTDDELTEELEGVGDDAAQALLAEIRQAPTSAKIDDLTDYVANNYATEIKVRGYEFIQHAEDYVMVLGREGDSESQYDVFTNTLALAASLKGGETVYVVHTGHGYGTYLFVKPSRDAVFQLLNAARDSCEEMAEGV